MVQRINLLKICRTHDFLLLQLNIFIQTYMGRISKKIEVNLVAREAYQKFINEFNEWWPEQYTWSQGVMHEITIDLSKDGLCSEIGPFGFRCDWGRITDFEEDTFIEMKWQVGPNREPVPNPDRASDILIEFTENEQGTLINFQHFNFGNHGQGAEDYRNRMDSEQGWDYILACFKKYCENIENPNDV